MIQDVECNVNHSWVFLSTPFTYRFVFFIATTHNTFNSKLSKLRLFGSCIICTSFFSYINADTCELSFWHLSACIMLKLQKGWMAGLISGWSTGGVVEQCLSFFGALRWVSLEWWERFVPMIMVVETEGMLQVLGTGKAYQQEPFHLKNRNVLTGINHLINALQPCVVEVLLEIVYCNLQRLEQ